MQLTIQNFKLKYVLLHFDVLVRKYLWYIVPRRLPSLPVINIIFVPISNNTGSGKILLYKHTNIKRAIIVH